LYRRLTRLVGAGHRHALSFCAFCRASFQCKCWVIFTYKLTCCAQNRPHCVRPTNRGMCRWPTESRVRRGTTDIHWFRCRQPPGKLETSHPGCVKQRPVEGEQAGRTGHRFWRSNSTKAAEVPTSERSKRAFARGWPIFHRGVDEARRQPDG